VKNRLILILLFINWLSLSCVQKISLDERTTLVFTNVTIIDTAGGPSKAKMTVCIADDRITEIRKGRIRVPEGIQVIDSKGKYMIPGLWDMHVHWYHEQFLPLFIANGVTGVRMMFGFPFHLDWRERTTRGELLAPRQVIASPIVDGPGATFSGSFEIGTEQEARDCVQNIKDSGFDFVR